jgi:hypothetical protein
MLILLLAVLVLILLLYALFTVVGLGVGIILFLVVAGLCAAIAEYVLGMREGVVTTVLIGLIGAAVGLIRAQRAASACLAGDRSRSAHLDRSRLADSRADRAARQR